MTNQEFDQFIRKLMRDYRSDYEPESWEDLEERLDQEANDPVFDEAIKSSLTGFVASGKGDWSRMEQHLIADEMAFDDAVKERIESYEAPYDPATWPVLDQKIDEHERLRRRLMTAKVLEITAILIACFTFYNFFPTITEAVMHPRENTPLIEAEPVHTDLSDASTGRQGEMVTSPVLTDEENALAWTDASVQAQNTEQSAVPGQQSDLIPAERQSVASAGIPTRTSNVTRVDHESGITQALEQSIIATPEIASPDPVSGQKAFDMPRMIAGVQPNVTGSERVLGLTSLTLSQAKQNGLRVGMGASTDLNVLYFPNDNFYSQGQQIKFSAKQLSAIGYSAGASVLFDNGPLTFETGLYYSLKSYEPNRILHIGETFDVRTLDFKKIDLNIISVPLLLHWNFDRKGKVHLYAAGGMNVNVIAVAHYDLIARNHFSSSAAPTDPQFQRTSQEVARIREHILDGAEFSAKSYMALSAGFGIERQINNRFSIFGQPTFNYQIPFFGISDQNGKDLQFGSLLLGTRIKLK